MAFTTGDNNFGTAKWIVDATAGQGTHTTIASALTAASSGQTIFIRPGTYTENLTLKAGVNLTAYDCDSSTPNVTISGKCSFSSAGTVTISGIRLQTNSDFALAVTGSVASIVNLVSCFINCSNNTGISYTSSSASSHVTLQNCLGDIATTGIALFAQSSAGTLDFIYSDFTNTGSSTTANTVSAGTCRPTYTFLANPVTTSSTGFINAQYSDFYSAAAATSLTCGGTGGTSVCDWCVFNGSTSSAISVGAGSTLQLFNCLVVSSNTNAITGAGVVQYSHISFAGSSTVNTTTQTPLVVMSTLGATTTNGIVVSNGKNLVNYAGPQIDSSGRAKNTSQPAFLAYRSSVSSNVTGDGTVATVICDTEVYDQQSNYDNTTGIFTAPVTGRYTFTLILQLVGVTVAHLTVNTILQTTNRTYYLDVSAIGAEQAGSAYTRTYTANCDMTAGDTAYCTTAVFNSTKVVSISGAASTDPRTFFSGFLIC